MGMVGRLPSGEEVMLPHPYIPCAWCGRFNMGWNACPNARDICNDCCGEETMTEWEIVCLAAAHRVAVARVFKNATRVFQGARLDALALLFLLASIRLTQDAEQLAVWLAIHEDD